MIGIMGGTFDPIHFGHLRPALEIAEQLALDEVRFIPNYQSPHKGIQLITHQHRVAMLEQAIANIPQFQCDTREIDRGGVSYTYDTLQSLQGELATNGETQSLVLMLGKDAFDGFPRWHRWQDILKLVHIAVSCRPGESREIADWAVPYMLDSKASLENVDIHKQGHGNIIFTPVTQLAISSTRIREDIVAGRAIDYLLPASVVDYIKHHKLYRH